MKKFLLAAALGVAGLATMPAHSLTASGTFDVTVNLFPKCEFVTPPSALSLRYVSFQTSDSTNTMDFSLRCTNTQVYTMGLSSSSGSLVGLNYSLELRNSGDTAAVTGGTGSGTTQSYKVRGTIAANQGGTCNQDNSGTTGSQDASATGTTGGQGTQCAATTASPLTLTITY